MNWKWTTEGERKRESMERKEAIETEDARDPSRERWMCVCKSKTRSSKFTDEISS